MKKTAVFPGTFDPYTKGHESVIQKVLPLFDKIIIGIGVNSEKSGFFPLKDRIEWIKEVYKNEPKIEVVTYNSLTVKFCKEYEAKYIIRGLRSNIDFDYEQQIAQINKKLDSEIETLFILTDPEYAAVSSSFVREIYKYKGDISPFIPIEITIK